MVTEHSPEGKSVCVCLCACVCAGVLMCLCVFLWMCAYVPAGLYECIYACGGQRPVWGGNLPQLISILFFET